VLAKLPTVFVFGKPTRVEPFPLGKVCFLNYFVLRKNLKDFAIFAKCRIYNTSFSPKLSNASNKLDCLIAPGWSGMAGTNTLAYRAYS
jgi:hypothetical protein